MLAGEVGTGAGESGAGLGRDLCVLSSSLD